MKIIKVVHTDANGKTCLGEVFPNYKGRPTMGKCLTCHKILTIRKENA